MCLKLHITLSYHYYDDFWWHWTYNILSGVFCRMCSEIKPIPAFISYAIYWVYRWCLVHGPLAQYVTLRVAHASRMLETFFSRPWISDPDMHHGTCVTHVSWCMLGLLISGFLWCRWQGKHFLHSRRMRNPQFYVSGKRSIVATIILLKCKESDATMVTLNENL